MDIFDQEILEFWQNLEQSNVAYSSKFSKLSTTLLTSCGKLGRDRGLHKEINFI
jgi:hypothetical protein